MANWDETQDLLRDAEVRWLMLAVPIALAGMTGIGVPVAARADAGRRRGQDHRRPAVVLPRPGGQVRARRCLAHRGPGGAAAEGRGAAPPPTAAGLSLATTYLGVVLLALLSFVPAVRHISDNPPLWVFALLPAGLLVLHPKVLSRIIALGERVLGKAVDVRLPSWRDTVVLVVMHVPGVVPDRHGDVVRGAGVHAGPPVLGRHVRHDGLVGGRASSPSACPAGSACGRRPSPPSCSVALPAGVGAAAALAARLIFMLVDTLGAMIVAGLARRRPPVGDVT